MNSGVRVLILVDSCFLSPSLLYQLPFLDEGESTYSLYSIIHPMTRATRRLCVLPTGQLGSSTHNKKRIRLERKENESSKNESVSFFMHISYEEEANTASYVHGFSSF